MTLDKIQKLIESFRIHKEQFPKMPDFEKMTEAELDKHIKMMLEKSHREKGIQSLQMALERLHWEFTQGLFNEKELELMKQVEINYWNSLEASNV